MKRFSLAVLFIFLLLNISRGQEAGYKTVTVPLPYGEKELYSTFYCFNDLKTGEQLAKELYGVYDLKKILKAGRFKKLIPVPLGSELTAYNYSIMTYGHEFWFFENRDDGWLWGTGRY